MKGVLKFSQHLLDHVSPELDDLIKQFVANGVHHKTVTGNGQVYMLLDHPDFTDHDIDTEYVLYFGNRYDRVTCAMTPKLLHLDKVGVHGRLEPVRYYPT